MGAKTADYADADDSGSARAPNHSILSGMTANAVLGVGTIISGIALIPLIIGTVGAGPYGLWLLLSTLATYLYQADLGMGSALVHFLSLNRDDPVAARRLVTTGFLWMTLAGLAALPVFLLIATTLIARGAPSAGLDSAAMGQLIAIGGVLLALLGLRAFASALQGSGYWVYQRGTQVVGVILRVVLTVIACVVFDSVVGVALAEAAALLVPTMLATYKAARLGLVSAEFSAARWEEARRLVGYGLRAFALGALAAILLQADTFIVGAVASAASVTYYSAGFRIYMATRQVIGWVVDPLVPALTQLYHREDARSSDVFAGMQFATLWVAVLICGGLAVAAPDAVQLWLGDDVPQVEIAWVVVILLSGLAINASYEAGVRGIAAKGRPGAFIDLYFWWCVLNVAISFVLGSYMGIVGVALGTVLPVVLLVPLFLGRVQSVLGYSRVVWLRACVVPIGLALAGGLSLAAGLFVAAASLGIGVPSMLAAVGYATGFVGVTRLLVRRLPHRELRAAAQARL